MREELIARARGAVEKVQGAENIEAYDVREGRRVFQRMGEALRKE